MVTMLWVICEYFSRFRVFKLEEWVKPKMIIVFFDRRSVVQNWDFRRQGCTVFGALFKDVLHCLLKWLRGVRPDLLDSGNWRFLHNKTPAHKSILLQVYATVFGEKACFVHKPPTLLTISPRTTTYYTSWHWRRRDSGTSR